MQTLKFKIKQNSIKTEPQVLNQCLRARISGFRSNIRDLSVVFEDKGSKAVYYIPATKNGFTKDDSLEFRKIWFEYKRSDRDYEIEVLIN